ncbi:MAG: hypothetical protein LBS46_01940, partial [Dysgonamonadaceae bacterium]|nr:hypothetical protein [Dysgonamonadaceae bacterium]
MKRKARRKEQTGGNFRWYSSLMGILLLWLCSFGNAAAQTTPLGVSVTDTVMPTCDKPNTGTLTFKASGSSQTPVRYTFTLSKNGFTIDTRTTGNGVDTYTFKNRDAGHYKVVVTDYKDATRVPAEVEVTLSATEATPLGVKVTASTQPTCDLPKSGTLSFLASGGTANHRYSYTLWNNGSIKGTKNFSAANATDTATFTGLEAGLYKVVVTDRDCAALVSAEVEVTLSAGEAIPLGVSVTDTKQPTCDDPDSGELSFLATGGTATPRYSYTLWENGSIKDTKNPSAAQATTPVTFTGLYAGHYTVVVIDRDCEALIPAEVEVTLSATDATPLGVSVTDTIMPTCDKPTIGRLEVAATGGTATPRYEYTLWKNGFSLQTKTSANPVTFTGLDAGHYKVVLIDLDCAALVPAEVEVTLSAGEAIPLGVSVDVGQTIPPTCDKPTIGKLVFVATGGTTPHQYTYTLWNNGSIKGTKTSGSVIGVPFTGLEAGHYKVVVTDNNCAALAPAEVEVTLSATDASPLVVSVTELETIQPTCDKPDSGKLVFEVTGGTDSPKYRYTLWKNGSILGNTNVTSNTFTKLEAGHYKVVVIDLDCAALVPAEVEVTLSAEDADPLGVKVNAAQTKQPTCDLPKSGELVFKASG